MMICIYVHISYIYHTWLLFFLAHAYRIAVCSQGQQLETHHNHTWQYLENDLTAQAAGSEDAWFD